MSKAVEGVTEKIEEYARKEFKSKGYVDASLRTIAMEAGTTTGSIYSRYGGKEGLFSALVEPAAREFTEIFEDVQKKFHAMESDMQTESLDEYSRNGMIQLVEYMYDHFEEFNLLVNFLMVRSSRILLNIWLILRQIIHTNIWKQSVLSSRREDL